MYFSLMNSTVLVMNWAIIGPLPIRMGLLVLLEVMTRNLLFHLRIADFGFEVSLPIDFAALEV